MRSPAARLRNLTKLGVVPDDEPAPPHEMQYTLQQVMQWNEQRVCQWVREQGFGKYEEAFHEQQVNGEALVELDYGLLKELSVRTVGERVRLNLAIRRLRQQCLHMDVDMDMGNGANPRNKRSVTLGSMPGVGGFAPHSAMELVASPGPLSATTVASMGMAAEPTLVGAFGLVPPFLTSAGARKELPILPRASMSSNSIGLSEVGESSGSGSSSSSSGGGGSGSARPSGNGNSILQRSNTDTRAFGAREHTHELISATVRKQKTAGGGPHRHTQQITPPHKTGGGAPAAVPLSAPVPRLRAQAGSQRAQKPGQGGDIERLGFQLQEFFGTDISVAHLADSLSVRTWQITIAGPENQVRQVQIANTNSAKAILDRVRRAFDLDNEIDGDQYSLFSMTSEGGGARCLTNEELSKMFSDPDSTPPEKFFLRKRHQLSRPPMGTKRSEHLQRAIERLGNIIPAASAQIPPPPPLHQLLLRPLTKWESTTEKLTKILGERPPSELVSMNVEKYFPGNEARARHSIMRRRKNESQEAAGPDGQDSTGRSSRRQSRANRRSSNTSARSMQARIRSLTLGSEERWSGFSNNLEPIKESLQSPAAPGLATPAPLPTAPAEPAASVDEAAAAAPSEAGAPDGDEQASRAIVTSPPPVSPNGSCASLQFSDDEDSRSGLDDDHNMGTLSDLSDSGLSDSFDDDSSFCNSLRDSDIYGDEDLATYDSELRVGADSVEALAGAGGAAADAAAAATTAAAAAATKDAEDERRHSVAQSVGAASRSGRGHGKKKTWIKGAPIASGSFGSVYFGMNTRTGVIMAVKEVDLPTPGSVSMSRNQRMADALRHELDLLKGLDHKNVVKYLGTDMDEIHLYIFLEYVSGGSVSSALASFGMFPESLVRTYTGQIIEGLVYLHEQGIIHRDIKGGNVLIDQDGSVKISDFGISKRVDEVVVAAASKGSRRASLQGSVFWMAPEVVKDTRYTVKGDVWSLGCLVIEMMTGTHPFPELDQMQALYTIGQRGRPQIPAGISATALDFLEQALQVDLDMRPTAKDLVPHAFVCTADDLPSP